MLKKVFLRCLLTLFLAGMLTLTFNIQRAQSVWTGTVYIRADGRIEPSTAPIQRNGNLYTFTANIYGCIVVERDNIVIDGAGYTLQGTESEKGIDLSGRTNVTVKNTKINNFQCGIYLNYSSNNSINGNNITANTGAGITLDRSSNNTISGNNIANNEFMDGIYLVLSSNNTISGNNIANNYYGVQLWLSSNNTISGNTISNSKYVGIDLTTSSNNTISGNVFVMNGLYVWESFGNVVVDNLVNGKPLVYLEGASNQSVSEAGQVILINCNNIVIKNLDIFHTFVGVNLWRTNNTVITQNSITANVEAGVLLCYSSNNTISGNNIANNYYGVHLWEYSNNNTISGNNIANNKYIGIGLDHSSNNTISGNNIANNYYYGLDLWASSYNIISGNNIANNEIYGVSLSPSSNNWFYHNNLINNTQQVKLAYGSSNYWDNGYPSGGNYWSDYAGVDYYSGPYQNIIGSDGIGDTPFVLDKNNVDNYPLMGPFSSFNTSVGYFVDVVSNSTVKDFIYFGSNSTIVLQVSNMTSNQTVGFCRLTIPHSVIAPPYTVKVNGTPIEYQTVYENKKEGISIIYFTYEHSTLEIVIISEFPSTLCLLGFLISITIPIIFAKKLQKANNRPKPPFSTACSTSKNVTATPLPGAITERFEPHFVYSNPKK